MSIFKDFKVLYLKLGNHQISFKPICPICGYRSEIKYWNKRSKKNLERDYTPLEKCYHDSIHVCPTCFMKSLAEDIIEATIKGVCSGEGCSKEGSNVW